MYKSSLFLLVSLSLAFANCTARKAESKHPGMPDVSSDKPAAGDLGKYHRATFAAGCFWCEEAVYESVKGVAEVISGYSGGSKLNPTYEEVGSGSTGHAESVEVYYDSSVVDYPTLLRVYFASIDPTQVNGQGPDIGTQYRSVIFYRNGTEKALAERYISELESSGKYSRPIAVQIAPFTKFWPAEGYHQDYVEHNPGNPYVQHESLPRLRRTQKQIPDLIKPGRSLVGQ
ncbi:MAG: peptide-methionine (S)-S-oxide reductase MsrA [Saprospiraceae bacterium]|nr:peptide-methionine (S)-S-oxide reductase MsrA [Saprospiraceae bacterium]